MCAQSVEEEVSKFKNSSKLKIRFIIFIYQVLKFMSGDVFYFINSLVAMLFPVILFGYNPITLFFILIVHYLFFWVFLKDRIEKEFPLKSEIKEFEKGIKILRSYLKKKNPN